MMRTSLALAGTLMVLMLPSVGLAQRSEQESVQQLQRFMMMRSYGEGEAAGRRLLSQYPNSRPLKAWWLIHMARSSRYYQERALQQAEAMVKEDREDPWSAFALAGVLGRMGIRAEEALELSDQFLRAFPGDWAAAWLRSTILFQSSRYREIVAFIDSWQERIGESAELLAIRGDAYNSLSKEQKDPALFEQALKSFQKAIETDPSNVGAHYLAGHHLNAKKRYREAHQYLSKAAGLAPCSYTIHRSFWVNANYLGEADQAAADGQMEAFLDRCASVPQAAYAVYFRARELSVPESSGGAVRVPERIRKLDALEERAGEIVVRLHPNSSGAESVLDYGFRDFYARMITDGLDKNPATVAEFRKLVRDFLQRPDPLNTRLVGGAWYYLFISLDAEATPDPQQLLESVEGVVKSGLSPEGTLASCIALADKTSYWQKAVEIAEAGLEASRGEYESRRARYDSDQEFQEATDRREAPLHAALGWAFFRGGQLKRAQKELHQAFEADPGSAELVHRLGLFYKERGRLDEAEEYFAKGVAIEMHGENPNDVALRDLYKARKRTLDGFDEYRGSLDEIDRRHRKRNVLNARIESPDQIPAFELKTLDGKTISLESLQGKIVVVNYWGIWCYWCVEELPELQLLHQKYKDNPDVVILTINNDPNPKDVPPWMKQKGYDFPVLLDDGYGSDHAEITTYPTTWYLDKQGRKIFEKVYWSKNLLEESAWRIDAIRQISR